MNLKKCFVFLAFILTFFSMELKALETNPNEFIDYINVTSSMEIYSTIIPYRAIQPIKEEDNKLEVVSVIHSNNPIIDEVIELAITKLDCPYSQERREAENTYDCSSFARRMYEEITGVYIGSTTHDISANLMPYQVSFDELEVGDIMFLKGHMAIYIGYNKDGVQQIIHATGSGDCVKIENLWGRINWTHAFRTIDYINNYSLKEDS